MLAKYEFRKYAGAEKVWIGKYKDLINLAHWHRDCEIIRVESGKATVYVDGVNHELDENDCTFVSPDTPHYVTAEKDSVLKVMLFDGRLVSAVTDKKRLCSPVLSGAVDIAAALEDIAETLRSKEEYYELSAELKAAELVINIFKTEKTEKTDSADEVRERFKALIAEMEKNIDFYDFETAAEFMKLSPGYFSKSFHAVFGMSFTKYLNALRVEKAISIMRDRKDASAVEISSESGFDTIRNYNRIFKEVTGYSPRQLPEDFDGVCVKIAGKADFDPTDAASELL